MTLKDLQALVVAWADQCLGKREPTASLSKLVLEEIPELAKDPGEDELADVAILVLDLAHLYGIDLEKAVLIKLDTNWRRKWKKDPATGSFKHV